MRAVQVAALRQPVAMAFRAGDPALYLASKVGRIWAFRGGALDPTPVLDLTDRVTRGTEQGLLGMAFSPDGSFLYVDYTDRRGDTNVVEYAWKDDRADPATGRRVLFVDQPYPNHNGGNLVFGPDGHLCIGMGDGGSDDASGPDHFRNGQNLGVLLGKMLRIDPRPSRGEPYGIPPDNPFVGRTGARPEIWAYGLRHPWRYSFDRVAGDLWIGDVGGGTFEEIDRQPAGSPGGQNYGWLNLEGTNPLLPPAPPNALLPSYEYGHQGGGCAIVGGYVYGGKGDPRA